MYYVPCWFTLLTAYFLLFLLINIITIISGSVFASAQPIRAMAAATYKLLLHILTTGQSDVALINCLQCANSLMASIGIESFLDSSNNKADWLKQTIIYCNHTRPALRTAARNFLVMLLHSTFQKSGSISRIRVPLVNVFHDSLTWIWGTLDKSKVRQLVAQGDVSHFLPYKHLLPCLGVVLCLCT